MRGYLGNQGRSRSSKGPRHGGGGGRGDRDGNRDNRGNSGGPRHEDLPPEAYEVDASEIISKEELSQSKKSMNLTELKSRPIPKLVELAESMGVEVDVRLTEILGAAWRQRAHDELRYIVST